MSTQSERSFATTTSRLEDQAASTAMHGASTSPSKSSSHPLLDEDGKLSAAGAATSLKYARAQDLPSFPSVGSSLSSAGAAASLADSRKKSFEHWQPGSIPAANKAAIEAQDYQMDPLWQPELSKAGSRAAIQAHRDAAPVKVWQASKSEHGQSAAGHALSRNAGTPTHSREVPAETRQKALLAATASFAGSRRRADSAPVAPDPSAPFAAGDPGFEAARLQNTAKRNINRQMYTSNPPVALEVEERNRQATLRASAIAMARKMYAIQQQHIEEAKAAKRGDGHHAARTVHGRTLSDTSDIQEEEETTPHKYYNLEEAAKKLAQERLAKLHDEHAEYRQYYVAQAPPPARSRLSFGGRRPRAVSEPRQDDDSDEEQSRKIRSQMSIFQSKLAAVDGKKRQADRDALLEQARKNVDKSINAMDEKVFSDTGKMSTQQRELWEKTARDRAQRESDERMVNHGKVHIGGGKYMDQSEIDAIARTRLQPTLDDISEKAEKQRARDEEIRQAEEQRKREAEAEKTRIATQKAEERAVAQKEKAELKAAADKEKEEQRVKRAEERRTQKEAEAAARNKVAEEKTKLRAEAAAEKERLRAEKEEKRKSEPKREGRFSNILGLSTAGEVAVGGGAAVLGAESAAATTTATSRPATGIDDAGEDQLAKADAVDRDPASKDEDVPATNLPGETESRPDAEEPAEGVEAKDEDEDEIEDGVEENKFVSSMPGESGYEDAEEERPVTAQDETEPVESPTSPGSPASPGKGDSKVRTWFKSRFRSSSSKKDDEKPFISVHDATTVDDKAGPIEEEKVSHDDSERDVALAGRISTAETDDMYGSSQAKAAEKDKEAPETAEDTAEPVAAVAERDPSPVSSLSESNYSKPSGTQEEIVRPGSVASSTDHPPRGRKGFRERILSKITSNKESNPGYGIPYESTKPAPMTTAESADNKDQPIAEEVKANGDPEPKQDAADVEEARDQFDEDGAAGAPKLNTFASGGDETAHHATTTEQALSPKGSREGSRFTEDL